MNPTRTYLGDAVYAEVQATGMIRLTTEDGISILNQIFLEPEVCEALVKFAKSHNIID